MKWLKFVLASLGLAILSRGAFAADIGTAAELATAIAADPSGTYTLTADIDCSGWTTIDGFSGTLDGKGHKILNLGVPFFGTITGDIAISNIVVQGANLDLPTGGNRGMLINSVTAGNLTVENVTFTGSTLRNPQKQGGNVGFVVGTFSVTGTASFKDCQVDDACSFGIGVGLHGGIIGSGTATGTDATISLAHCTMAAAISMAGSYGSQFGGIAGSLAVNGSGKNTDQFAHLYVSGCTNYTGNTSAWGGTNRGYAGIVYSAGGGGNSAMGEGTFRCCANYGSYTSNGGLSAATNFGGILGYWGSGNLTMEDCVNYGNILCETYNSPRPSVGGMVGVIEETWKGGCRAEIVGCANCGDIRGLYAGGMVGYVTHNANMVGTTIIKSCLNTGTLTTPTGDILPGQAISMLTSGIAYPVVTIEGGLWTTNALIGTYADNATVTAFSTEGNIFLDVSEGLVDGSDLAALNAYNENSNLWKQGHEHPILKIMPDEAVPDTIVATFADWDATVLKQVTISRGGHCYPPDDPVREGSSFLGWEPGEFTNLQQDTTFTAQYSSGVLRHTVTFRDWDDTQIGEAQEVVHGEAAVAPADRVREGYIFTGWSPAFDNVTEDLVVRAQYVPLHVYVATAEDLAAALTAETLPGVTVHLSADVELPPDWSAPDFRATFDGGGRTILCPNGGLPLFDRLYGSATNFVVDAAAEGAPTTNSIPANAVFGAVARTLAGGAIRDVTVENLVITLENNNIFGFIAGRMLDGAAIERCTAAASCLCRQKQTAGAGGIAGVIERTSEFAPVDGENNPIVGETLALVADCTNRAPVVIYSTGPLASGGIVGRANVHNTTYIPAMRILRCANEADVAATVNLGSASVHFGGILGERNVNAGGHGGVLSIVGCANLGDICSPGTTNANLGGIVGCFWRGCETVLDRCVNRGNIGTAVAGDGTTAVTGNDVGGIIGQASSLYTGNPVTATNCANYGAVTGGANVGGFVGYFDANGGHSDTKLMFYNCANYGTIVGTTLETLAGQIFGKFGATVATSSSRQYGAVNSFFMTPGFYAEDSGSAIITNGLVTAADEGYAPSPARKKLNSVAEGDDSYEPWVLGRVGDAVFPELECFMTRAGKTSLTIIIR